MDRREGTLGFAPDQGVLVVGGRTAVLDAMPPAEVVVGTYVELVASQRAVRPTKREDLRDRELVELARLLELPPAELDALLDREIARILDEAAAPTGTAAPRRRRTLALGALAVVAAALAAAAVANGAGAAHDPEPGSTVETITLSDGSTATRTESAPAPAGDGVDVGTAVVIERNP